MLCKLGFHRWLQLGSGFLKMVEHNNRLMRSEWWHKYVCSRCPATKEKKAWTDHYYLKSDFKSNQP